LASPEEGGSRPTPMMSSSAVALGPGSARRTCSLQGHRIRQRLSHRPSELNARRTLEGLRRGIRDDSTQECRNREHDQVNSVRSRLAGQSRRKDPVHHVATDRAGTAKHTTSTPQPRSPMRARARRPGLAGPVTGSYTKSWAPGASATGAERAADVAIWTITAILMHAHAKPSVTAVYSASSPSGVPASGGRHRRRRGASGPTAAAAAD